MPQQRNRDTDVPSGTHTTNTTQMIEKGWTVLDAVERPIGNVTDVDLRRDQLVVDGRPAGFDAFEIPLSAVRKTADGEVHLTKVIDPATSTGVPSLIDPPKDVPRSSTKAETMAGMGSSRTTTTSTTGTVSQLHAEPTGMRIEMPNVGPVGSTASPTAVPHAATAPTDPRVTPIHSELHEEHNGSWGKTATKMAVQGVALGGLAAAGYLIRQKMRRKSRFERFKDASTDFASMTADFARERHPAWWGGLAASLLPVAAYYAKSSLMSQPPSRSQRAHDQYDDMAEYLEQQLEAFSRWLPAAGAATAGSLADGARRLQHSAGHLEMPSNWNRPGSWSLSTEATLSAALIAVSGLAIYLARRSPTAPRTARVSDVMTRRPRTIHPNTTVADAAALMRQMDIGGLPVCDGSRLVGMVTDRDITVRSAADGRDPHLTPVRDVMSEGVAWATENDPVEEAARIMREHRIRRLPIVDERHSLVGVVSLGDLAVDVNDRDLSGKALEDISEPSKPSREM